MVFKEVINEPMTEETKAEKAVFEKHSEMNPLFWTDKAELVPGLRDKLIAIVMKYVAYLKLPEHIKFKDIVFTGSLAGFNYTDFSDVDIHLIVDYKAVSDDEEFAGNYFRAMKDLWTSTHDVTVHGFPVELFAQDKAQAVDSPGAAYSLVTNTWIKEPENPPVTIDRERVLRKAESIQEIIDDLLHEEPSEELLDDIEELKVKIKNMRQSALAKGGEFAPENLAFKVLRNNGYLEKLTQLNKKAQETLLSVNEGF